MFSGTVAVVFKIIFHSKMHLNNIFFILKNLFFDISILKQFKNIKKFKIFGTVVIQKYKHKIIQEHLYFHYLLVHHVINIFHLFIIRDKGVSTPSMIEHWYMQEYIHLSHHQGS